MNNDNNILKSLIEKIRKDKKTLLIIIIGMVGMLLITMSEFSSDKSEERETDNCQTSFEFYDNGRELESLISKIDGAGKCSVMITYECSQENVYAQNQTDQREENGKKSTGEYIIVGNGNKEEGLVLKRIYPVVQGVAVVCQGGDNPVVKNEITMLLKAIYGIGSNKICITKMQNQEVIYDF